MNNIGNEIHLLQNFTKDELIKKCTYLINIVQNLNVGEVSRIEINKLLYNAQPETNETQELNEEKSLINRELESLAHKNKALEAKLSLLEDQNMKNQDKIQVLEKENNSLQTWVNQLNDENDQLKINLSTLQSKLLNQNQKMLELNSNQNECLEIEQNYYQKTNEQLKNKLKLYFSKLKKFSLTIKQIKKEKNEIIELFKLHTENLVKWQKDLLVVSTDLVKLINSLKRENQNLREMLKENLETRVAPKKKSHFVASVIELAGRYDLAIQNLDFCKNSRDIVSEHQKYGRKSDFEANSDSSIISKSNDIDQIKNLEESWEDRYGKLRALAVKLKAKIKEQTSVINNLQADKEGLETKYVTASKTIQNMQCQIDSLQESLEKGNDQNSDKLRESEVIISKLKNDIDKYYKEKQELDNWKKLVSAKVKTLRKELENKDSLIKEYEIKLSKYDADLGSKVQTSFPLDHANRKNSKETFSGLEGHDSTKIIEEQKRKISDIQMQFDDQKSTLNRLNEQNKFYEERIHEEELKNHKTILEMGILKQRLAELEETIQHKDENILELTELIKIKKCENEKLSEELSTTIMEHQGSLHSLESERDQQRTQILTLQQSLMDIQHTLQLKDQELVVVKQEYENYKIRAQSVFKKHHQGQNVAVEEKLLGELSTLKSLNTELSNDLEEFRQKLAQCSSDLETTRAEKETLARTCSDLEKEINELKTFSAELSSKYEVLISEHTDTVRNLKVQAEMLSGYYQQQLSAQELRYKTEILELQNRLDKSPPPVESSLQYQNMPREEGEGSESNESKPAFPVALEKLLESKSDEDEAHLRKKISDQESQIFHLTTLLSDTEQDLAKHVQMNKVLKEEIRKQQRSDEREKHAENLEYLKNVVLKFITLTSGNERTRMVPVLNTILKLSPDETNMLLMIAKEDSKGKGWTSYLPSWPNSPK